MTRKELSSFWSLFNSDWRPLYNGNRLDMADEHKVIQSLKLYSLLCEDLLCFFQPYCDFDARLYFESIINYDVAGFAVLLKKVDTFWKNEFILPSSCPEFEVLFKGERADFTSRRIYNWLKPIRYAFDCNEIKDDITVLAFVLNSFCNFVTRVNVKNDELQSDLIDSFVAFEQRDEIELDDCILSDLNTIIKEWFKDWCMDGVPHHSKGAVASVNVVSLEEKYRDMVVTPRVNVFLNRHPEYRHLFSFSKKEMKRTRPARLISVPKSLTSYRLISAEPSECQFLQQAVKDSLYDFLQHHPKLKRCFPLTDQTQNNAFARKGSSDGSYATIDLSNASDSVTWKLVKAVFSGTPLLPYLYLTRSNGTVVRRGKRSTIVDLKMFAPMGSALCFPIETIVFGSIVELVMRRNNRRNNTDCYSVYGDDIICQTPIAADVIALLLQLGFQPNSQKSFISLDNQFRESCGKEYYCGVDVSPLRLPRNFSLVSGTGLCTFDDFKTISQYAQIANKFSLLSPSIREVLIRSSLQYKEFCVFGFSGFLSPNATNFHLHHVRRNNHVSITFKRYISRFEPCKECTVEEEIRYMEWHRKKLTTQLPVFSDVTRAYPRVTTGTSPHWLFSQE